MPASRTQKEKATTPEGREVKVRVTRLDLVVFIVLLIAIVLFVTRLDGLVPSQVAREPPARNLTCVVITVPTSIGTHSLSISLEVNI